ncbi:DUF1348 family protein [Sphingomonas sp. PAMC 26605]|uniref:DUF1348 family protein n=1 Tax=Sphingomonas sp. PAMC 26605 TaxID=1112214 RepID=UPI00026CB1CA|nr:DUF1348 family protein [Sphingomonas sp. PAMC 26605]
MMKNRNDSTESGKQQRVRDAEHTWNTHDCDAHVMNNAIDCLWRNRFYFIPSLSRFSTARPIG